VLRTRDDFYRPGIPAVPGKHYRALVRFAKRHAGSSILDLGCGFGAYSNALTNEGLYCFGCDIDMDYLRTAHSLGVPVAAIDSALPFADRSFETVMLLEVIEHVSDLERILKEAFRVARRNVLVTVPNSEDIELLRASDVTYAHMLSSDHLHFFSSESLKSLLHSYTREVTVERSDPIYPFWFLRKSAPYYIMRLAFRVHLLKPRFFSRLYAVASVQQD
jgi:ubiquinone/menaquinone biosynthesis C-methylase UbiE